MESIKVSMDLPEDLNAKIEEYRWNHKIDSKAEAMRELVRRGLQAEVAARD